MASSLSQPAFATLPSRSNVAGVEMRRLHAAHRLCARGHKLSQSCPLIGAPARVPRRPRAVRATAGEAQGSSGQTVQFVLVRECCFGQAFYVAGSIPALGEWDLEKSLPLEWNEGHIWIGSAVLSPEELEAMEFKFVMMGKSGEVEWQPSGNHRLGDGTGPDIAATGGLLIVHRSWDCEELGPLPGEFPAGESSLEDEAADSKAEPVVSEGAGEEGSIAEAESEEGEWVGGLVIAAESVEGEDAGDAPLSDAVGDPGAAAPVADLVEEESTESYFEAPPEEPSARAQEPLAASPSQAPEASNGAVKGTKRRKRTPSPGSFAQVVEKDAEWGRSVWAGLLSSWGRKPLMEEESSRQ